MFESAAASSIDQHLLDSLERAFANHAGDADQLGIAELRVALGLRTESIAKRMFAIFDVRGNGTISRDEFIAAVRRLVARIGRG
ncbi:MAG: hypothetical protein ABI591_19195 [Kofleriaceae bacterium]